MKRIILCALFSSFLVSVIGCKTIYGPTGPSDFYPTPTSIPLDAKTPTETATNSPTSTVPKTATPTESPSATNTPLTAHTPPTTSLTPTSTATLAPWPTPACAGATFLGDVYYEPGFTVPAVKTYYMQSFAAVSGTVSVMGVNFNSAGTSFVVGIYSDNSGKPGSLLASSNMITPYAAGWNTAQLTTPVNITASNYYWLAIYYEASSALSGGDNISGYTYLSASGAPGLPSTYGGGATSNPGWLAIYADICPSSTPSPTGTPTPVLTATPTASSTATATSSTTAGGWDVAPGFVSMGGGNYNYTYIHLQAGATMMLDGPATFNVTDYFSMESGSFLEAQPWSVTAGSPAVFTSSAGAGHGGAGGNDGLGNAGGSVYDSPTAPTMGGSEGAQGGCISPQSYGGGFIFIQANNGTVTLNGLLESYAQPGENCYAGSPTGGASGGAIYVMADSIEGNGMLTAAGGSGIADASGGGDNSGGGGGGIIVLSTHTVNNFTGTNSVSGGTAVSPAQAGQSGIFNQTTY